MKPDQEFKKAEYYCKIETSIFASQRTYILKWKDCQVSGTAIAVPFGGQKYLINRSKQYFLCIPCRRFLSLLVDLHENIKPKLLFSQFTSNFCLHKQLVFYEL